MCEKFPVLRHTSVLRYTTFKKQPAPFLSSSWLPLQATMAGFNLQHQQQGKEPGNRSVLGKQCEK